MSVTSLAPVGPVLESSELARVVIAAMLEVEPRLTVLDRGSYLRVSAPGVCTLHREIVERMLGRKFQLPGDLEALMPSFTGSFDVTPDRAEWRAPEPRS